MMDNFYRKYVLPRQARLYWCLGLSVFVSFGWLWVSLLLDSACGAGRGGTIGVIIAFTGFFVSRPHAERRLEMIDGKNFENASQEDQIESIRSALAIHLDSLRSETLYVFLASAFATLVSGFGDLIAEFAGAAVC